MSRERLFEPFAGWLIQPEWAARVIAGAYDTKSPAERREIVSTNPYSYLGVTPISPIITIPSVSGSFINNSTASFVGVPIMGSPPMPIAVD